MTMDHIYTEEHKSNTIERQLIQLINRQIRKLAEKRLSEKAEVERTQQGQGPSTDIFDAMERETYRANDIQHNGAV